METWLVAVVGGAVGTVLGWLLAVADRFRAARAEVLEHDALVAAHDEDLTSWVSDRDLGLRRELRAKKNELAARNMLRSGEYGYGLALLKERALHEFRDERRRVDRSVAAARAVEGRFHMFWRRVLRRPFSVVSAPKAASPILDEWRGSITGHGGRQVEVIDPTRLDLADAVAALTASGSDRRAEYV